MDAVKTLKAGDVKPPQKSKGKPKGKKGPPKSKGRLKGEEEPEAEDAKHSPRGKKTPIVEDVNPPPKRRSKTQKAKDSVHPMAETPQSALEESIIHKIGIFCDVLRDILEYMIRQLGRGR